MGSKNTKKSDDAQPVMAELTSLLNEAKELSAEMQTKLDLDNFRSKFLGRKSRLNDILRSLSTLDPQLRKETGAAANKVKQELTVLFDLAKDRIAGQSRETGQQTFDYTLPGRVRELGKRHILTQVMDEIVQVFYGMGFEVADGPDIETDYYNFTALNFPPDHPARDMQDTFFISGDYLLRTHTSPVQIRTFEKHRPPVRILAPGRSYRHEAINARSYCQFYQVEGFYVDTHVTFADLKGVLSAFAEEFFGREAKLRFRPSFFPFTEPSTEVDLLCLLCSGKGCQLCKYDGWLEILGAGMIDPEVFAAVDYDPEVYSGYAFGMGVDRVAMLRHRIDDIRLFYENDLRFLRQF